MNTPLVKGLIGAGAVVIGLLGFGLLTQTEEAEGEVEGEVEGETESVKADGGSEGGSENESTSEAEETSVKKVDDDLVSIPPETSSPQPSPIRKKRRTKETTESVKIIRV